MWRMSWNLIRRSSACFKARKNAFLTRFGSNGAPTREGKIQSDIVQPFFSACLASVSRCSESEPEGAKKADCAQSAEAVQGAGAGSDGPDAGSEHRSDGGATLDLSDRMARVLRLLRDPLGAQGSGLVGQAAIALRRLEAVEAGAHPVRGVKEAGREQESCGQGRRKCSRTVELKPQPSSQLRAAKRLLRFARSSDIGGTEDRLTNRTAVYGPVRTVV